jgi:hypothetical protein
MGAGASKSIAGYSVIGVSNRQDAAFKTKLSTTILNVFNTKPYVQTMASTRR